MNFDELMEQIKNPIDLTGNFDAADIEKNKIYGILASIPPLFFLPLVAAKDSAYGKFCANQGLTITILSVLAGAIPAILGFIPFIGGLLGAGPVMPLRKGSAEKFINLGGRLPAPLQSLKN